MNDPTNSENHPNNELESNGHEEHQSDSASVEGSEPSYRDVFKNKDFMRLLSGQFFSNFGDAIFRIAIIMYVYSITGSKTQMTLVLAAQTIPWVIIAPIAGVFADRVNRKTMMISSDILRGVSIILLPFMTSIFGIVIISFFIGLASASFVAPRSAAIPEITGLRLYVKAISLSQLVFQTLAVLGPLIAAPIYPLLGSNTFWIIAGCYFISAVILSFTKIPSASRDKAGKITVKTVFIDMKEGYKYLFKHNTVRILIILFSFLILGTAFAGPLLFPYLFEIVHGQTPAYQALSAKMITLLKTINRYDSLINLNLIEKAAQTEYGILGAFGAAGAIIGNLAFGKYEKKIGRGRAIFMGSFAMAAFYIIFIFGPSFILLVVFNSIFGIVNGMFSLSINAIFAESVPNEVRGRAYGAVNSYIQILSVICLSLSGFTADNVGIIATMVGSGAFLLVTTILIAIFTKNYRFASEPTTTLTLTS